MFLGRHEHTMDSKGRVSVPARFRERIEEEYRNQLILTNEERCLVLYPQDEWKNLMEKLATLPQMKLDVKSFQRFFVSGACECSIDRQGRILIPPILRDYAGLRKDLIFVGIQSKIEIWDKERWNEELEKSKASFVKFSDSIGV